MATRSLRASSRGIEKANIALSRYGLNQNALAIDLGLSRQTVNNFFKQKPIDRENFALICDRLGLELDDLVLVTPPRASSEEQVSDEQLDELVESVRGKMTTDIQMRCGAMRVLDMTKPIALDTIYTDVNILQEITGRRRLDLSQILEQRSLEDFDRLGFTTVTVNRVSGIEAVEHFDKLILLGKPGAGKTTFMKRLAMLCSAGVFQAHRVPLFIPLRDFAEANGQPRLLEFIQQRFITLQIRGINTAKELLTHGRVLVLLDGLDEVRQEDGKRVLQEIQSFSNQYSSNAFVITCRIAAHEYTFEAFTEVEIADFDDEQIADFATKWFAAKDPDKTERFLQRLKENKRIHELAASPLLLTLLCLVFEGRTDFPANRSELYEEGVDVLLKKWDGTRSIEREQVYKNLSLKRKEDLLSQIAFATFEQGNYFFKQKEIERYITAYIQNLPEAQKDPETLLLDSAAVLRSIEAQHGLVVERASGIYSFSHLTFHEYFTARRIEKCHDLLKQLVTHVTETRWREVFLLTAGMLQSADTLMQLMKAQIDNLLVHDEKLQQFLIWLNEKAESVETCFKPAAVRSYYFALDQAYDYDLALSLDSGIALTFTPLSIDTRAIDRYGSFALDQAFVHTYNLALGPIHDNSLALALEQTYDQSGSLKAAEASKLQQSLIKLRDKLEAPVSLTMEMWWEMNRKAWTEQLREIMISHRNIGHEWYFTNAQQELLTQYYNASKLLVNCLNSDCYITRSVREEIESTLLLPTVARSGSSPVNDETLLLEF
jgi:predicted NACHT family NTPase